MENRIHIHVCVCIYISYINTYIAYITYITYNTYIAYIAYITYNTYILALIHSCTHTHTQIHLYVYMYIYTHYITTERDLKDTVLGAVVLPIAMWMACSGVLSHTARCCTLGEYRVRYRGVSLVALRSSAWHFLKIQSSSFQWNQVSIETSMCTASQDRWDVKKLWWVILIHTWSEVYRKVWSGRRMHDTAQAAVTIGCCSLSRKICNIHPLWAPPEPTQCHQCHTCHAKW